MLQGDIGMWTFSEPLIVLTFDYQYSKSLGNAWPKSVTQLENVIWRAIFDIACGTIDVYAAARSISDAIPSILDNLEDDDGLWFHLGLPYLF